MATLFKLAEKVAAFKDKLKLWEQRVNKGVFDMFQTLAETLKDSEPDQTFSDPGPDPARKFRGGAISVIFGSQVSVGSQVSFRIVQIHGEKCYFRK